MTFTPNSLSQRDPRWSEIKLGFSTSLTIGTEGCALTCLAMMATGYGYPETPETLNKKLIALGSGNGYIGPLMVWGGLTRLYPKIGIKEVYACSEVKPVPLKRIDALLANGQTVLVECDRSLATGEQSHWVLLTKKVGEDYAMLDPYAYPVDSTEILLTNRYGYGRPIQQVITAVAFYECWENGGNASTTPITFQPGLFVRVLPSVTSGLRIRVQPNTTATIVTVEIARTPLLVLDDSTDALAKIGVKDQWLKIHDPQGYEGYVAAWYVEKLTLPEPPPEPEPQPEPEPIPEPIPEPKPEEPLTAYVSAEVGSSGLRLRSQPSLDGVQLTILKASEPVEVLESAEIAISKIGVQNQWLHVRTILAEEGYCAAWLLVLPEAPPPTDGTTTPDPGSDPVPEPEPLPEPQPEPTPLTVIVSQSVGSLGLRLRAAPVNGSVVFVLPGGTRLTVIESADTAGSKIGVVNQWLNIKDEAGHIGFVAAWYVELETASGTTVPPGGDLGTLSVNVSPVVGSGGLRLRSAPNTSASVVRNLPANTTLLVLESAALARTKIGVLDQWLNIRTPDATEGYVAAWYVVTV
jgi:hypothetical protein